MIISFRVYVGSASWVIKIIFILIKGTYCSQVGVLNGTVIHRLTCLPEKGRSPDPPPTLPPQPFSEALPWLGAGKMLCSLSWILVRFLQGFRYNRKNLPPKFLGPRLDTGGLFWCPSVASATWLWSFLHPYNAAVCCWPHSGCHNQEREDITWCAG